MSFATTFNVFQDQRLTAGQTLVLAGISTFASDTGKCWPSIATIAAAQDGTQSRTELLQLLFMGQMTIALERAGFVFEGMTGAQVSTLVQNALEGLNPADLRQVFDMHAQQCEAASAHQYLKARQTLQIG